MVAPLTPDRLSNSWKRFALARCMRRARRSNGSEHWACPDGPAAGRLLVI